MARAIKKREFGGAPPIDFLDLSYFMPLMTAAALKESAAFPISYGGPLKMLATLAQPLGSLARRQTFERFVKVLMVNEYEATGARPEKYAGWVTRQYDARRYNYIVIGPPLGSLVYLSSILDAPFLPLNYAVACRRKAINPDDIKEHLDTGRKLADYYLNNNPDIQVTQEYDPVHQRLRIKNGSILRCRFQKLPKTYRTFIKRHLAENGTIMFIESRIGWRQYKVKDNFFFQIGTPGGIPDDEYIRGSKRLELFRQRFLQDKAVYRLPLPNELQPESKFGVTPSIRNDTLAAAYSMKRNICQLFTNDIYQINKLVSRLFLLCARREGLRPSYCYVQSGQFLSPYWCMQTLTVPIWVPSPCYPALQYVDEFLKSYPFEIEEVLLSFEPSIEEAPDFIMLKRWKETIGADTKIRYIGMNPSRYPADFNAFFKYWPELSKWAKRRRRPMDMRITTDNFIDEAQNCGIHFQITENNKR